MANFPVADSTPGARLLRGATLSTRLRDEIAAAMDLLTVRSGRAPVLTTVLVGSPPPAIEYRKSIVRSAARVGLTHRPVDLPVASSTADLAAELRRLNDDPTITGVLVLMPLPPAIPAEVVLETLSPLKDVDGITPTNAGRLYLGLPSLRPSTPQGGIELLDHHQIPIAGARATVIGRSNVVGRPLAIMLTLRHATVTICHRQTRDLAAATQSADIVAVAAGHPGLVTPAMVAPGATVLDFGVNVVNDRVVGDADFDALADHAGAITPVPGGTGPVTALVLMRNTIAAGFAVLGGTLDHVRDIEFDALPA